MSILSKTFGVLAVSAISLPSLAVADPASVTARADFLQERYGSTLGNAVNSAGCVPPATYEDDGLLAYDIGRNTAIVIDDKDTISLRLTFQDTKGRKVCDSSRSHGGISSGLSKLQSMRR